MWLMQYDIALHRYLFGWEGHVAHMGENRNAYGIGGGTGRERTACKT